MDHFQIRVIGSENGKDIFHRCGCYGNPVTIAMEVDHLYSLIISTIETKITVWTLKR